MGRGMQVLAGGGTVLLLALGAPGAGAGEAREPSVGASPVIGPNFRISGGDAFNAGSPAAVWNGTANEYLVVWLDGRDVLTRGWDVYGRRVSSSGAPLGRDFRISGPSATSNEDWPAVAWNDIVNEYLVVWFDGRDYETRGNDIYGRRISATGSLLGADFRISAPHDVSDEEWPAVVWNGTAGEYLVVWADDRDDTTRGSDVYGRRVSAAGIPVGRDIRLRSGPGNDAWPTVVWNAAANEYLVVWQDDGRFSVRGYDVCGRRVSATGAPLERRFRIGGPGAGWELVPALVWNAAANEYLVVWWDDRDGESPGGNDIVGRRVAADGSRLGAELLINSSDSAWPAAAWNATVNEYLVVWGDGRDHNSGRGDDIYGQAVAAGGQPVGADFRISGPGAIFDEGGAEVVWNETVHEFLVIWIDDRGPSDGWAAIYGQRVAG